VSQLAQLPKDKLCRKVEPRCSFEASSVYIVHLLALAFPHAHIHLVWIDPYPLVPAAADSKETCRPSYTPRSIPIKPPKARPLVFSLILAYTCQVSHEIPLQTNFFRVFCRGRAVSCGLDGSDVASANVQMAAMRLVQSRWQLGRYGVRAHVGVVVVWEEGCGRRNNMFHRLTMRPVFTINELDVRDIEIAEGVVISTPSVTHLVGLPHQGSPLACSDPSTLAFSLRNKAHISR